MTILRFNHIRALGSWTWIWLDDLLLAGLLALSFFLINVPGLDRSLPIGYDEALLASPAREFAELGRLRLSI